jgi:hypothetical protein
VPIVNGLPLGAAAVDDAPAGALVAATFEVPAGAGALDFVLFLPAPQALNEIASSAETHSVSPFVLVTLTGWLSFLRVRGCGPTLAHLDDRNVIGDDAIRYRIADY